MLTFDQVLAEQEDLAGLCQPKTENRYEVYAPNDNYGFAYILKKYAGYPIEEPIMATLPHGIYFRDKVLPNSEISAPLPAVLNYPAYTTQLWKKMVKNKKIISSASPIHYALKMFKSEVPQDQREGTLFMPKHSTQAVDVNFDKVAVIKELEDLPDEFKPITVCIHWNDVEKGLDQHFKSLGFNVVCAGHLTDCNYLFRWLHLLSRHKLTAHCGLGSALFYSVAAGTPFYLTKEDATTTPSERFKNHKIFNKEGAHYSKNALERMARLRKIFSMPTGQITQPQMNLVHSYTQKEIMKSPQALNKELQSLKHLTL